MYKHVPWVREEQKLRSHLHLKVLATSLYSYKLKEKIKTLKEKKTILIIVIVMIIIIIIIMVLIKNIALILQCASMGNNLMINDGFNLNYTIAFNFSTD